MKTRTIKGFSLLEAVLTMAVIGLGFVGVTRAVGAVSASSLVANQSIIATNIAAQTLEQIIAQRDCTAIGCGYAAMLISVNITGSYNANPVPGFPGYAVSAAAQEVSGAKSGGGDDFLVPQIGSGYARVTATVSWNGGASSLKLVTVISNY